MFHQTINNNASLMLEDMLPSAMLLQTLLSLGGSVGTRFTVKHLMKS